MTDLTHLIPLRGVLKQNEPMAKHVSWRAGGAAQRAYWPADLDDLVVFLKQQAAEEPIHFVGLGSNLLVRDGGLKGTVVFPHGQLNRIDVEMNGVRRIFAEAGVASPKVARFASRHEMEGAEFLAGVPGTVGGALAMNAGCYGSETWDFVDSVVTIDRQGTLRTRTPADYDIGYRHLELLEPGQEEWFVAARFRFPDGDEERAKLRIKEWLTRRIETQPLDQPNAGSTFRNPPADHAARLIESCGLKGYAIGAAQVSTKHANFIVNLGGINAKNAAKDIEALIGHMRDTVLKRTGVHLQQEVRIIGETT